MQRGRDIQSLSFDNEASTEASCSRAEIKKSLGKKEHKIQGPLNAQKTPDDKTNSSSHLSHTYKEQTSSLYHYIRIMIVPHTNIVTHQLSFMHISHLYKHDAEQDPQSYAPENISCIAIVRILRARWRHSYL